jgi:hypothetical protein
MSLFQSYRSILDFYSAGWNKQASAIWTAKRCKRTNGSMIGISRIFGTHNGIYYIDPNDYSRAPGGVNGAITPNQAQITAGLNSLQSYTHNGLIYSNIRSSPLYTTIGGQTQITQTLIVPQGVTLVSVICIGGGGGSGRSDTASSGTSAGGGGGGALRYMNNFPVTPGDTITVRIGLGGVGGGGVQNTTSDDGEDGGDSEFEYNSVVQLRAEGGTGGKRAVANAGSLQAGTAGLGGGGTGTGTFGGIVIGGHNGTDGGPGSHNQSGGAGGAAGGYVGGPSSAARGGNNTNLVAGEIGSGGSGGNGASGQWGCGGGGGTGPYGQGASGFGGAAPTALMKGGGGGGGGSWAGYLDVVNGGPSAHPFRNGGSDADPDPLGSNQPSSGPAHGGWYGGGGGAEADDDTSEGGSGAPGCVRVIWGGGTFPSNGVYSPNNSSSVI